MKVQLTKIVSTVVAIIDFRDLLDHSVESIGDEGAAHKAYKYSCYNYRF